MDQFICEFMEENVITLYLICNIDWFKCGW